MAARCSTSSPTATTAGARTFEVTFGEVMPAGEPPLLKRRRQLTRQQAIKLWAEKRQQGWKPCEPQWLPPPSPADR
jgi:Protein of unknown function (DUF1651).